MGWFSTGVHRAHCNKCGWKGPKRDNESEVRRDVVDHSC